MEDPFFAFKGKFQLATFNRYVFVFKRRQSIGPVHLFISVTANTDISPLHEQDHGSENFALTEVAGGDVLFKSLAEGGKGFSKLVETMKLCFTSHFIPKAVITVLLAVPDVQARG